MGFFLYNAALQGTAGHRNAPCCPPQQPVAPTAMAHVAHRDAPSSLPRQPLAPTAKRGRAHPVEPPTTAPSPCRNCPCSPLREPVANRDALWILLSLGKGGVRGRAGKPTHKVPQYCAMTACVPTVAGLFTHRSLCCALLMCLYIDVSQKLSGRMHDPPPPPPPRAPDNPPFPKASNRCSMW